MCIQLSKVRVFLSLVLISLFAACGKKDGDSSSSDEEAILIDKLALEGSDETSEHKNDKSGALGKILGSLDSDGSSSQKLNTQEPIKFELIPFGDSLIINGDFENHNLRKNSWKVFAKIDGWSKNSGAGIEVQNLVAGDAYEGNAKIELDSHYEHSNSSIIQYFKTNATTTYRLTFAYSPRPNVTLNSNKIEVRWNNELIATLAEEGRGLKNTKWTLYSFDLKGAQTESSIEFKAVGREDTFGGYIDHVAVHAMREKVDPSKVAPIVLDTPDAQVVGSWVSSKVVSGFNGSDYLHNDNADANQKSVVYKLDLPYNGYWQVFARWTEHSNRATNAVYGIDHAEGYSRVVMNQKIQGGKWNDIGAYKFDAHDQNAKVTLSAHELSDGYVIADAIRLVFVGDLAPSYALSAPFTIDNNDWRYVKIFGQWKHSSVVQQYEGQDYLHDDNAHELNQSGEPQLGQKRVEFIPDFAEAKKYKVYVRWTSHENRATNALIVVKHKNGQDRFIVNQKLGGGVYQEVGEFEFDTGRSLSAGAVVIQRPDDANGHVIADSVRFE